MIPQNFVLDPGSMDLCLLKLTTACAMILTLGGRPNNLFQMEFRGDGFFLVDFASKGRW